MDSFFQGRAGIFLFLDNRKCHESPAGFSGVKKFMAKERFWQYQFGLHFLCNEQASIISRSNNYKYVSFVGRLPFLSFTRKAGG